MKKICFLIDSIFTIGGVQRVTAVIAKALSAYADVTIATFDKPDTTDTSLYGLNNAPLHYLYVSYPEISKLERTLCRTYSGLYRKLHLQSEWASAQYGYSSFPPTMRKLLIQALQGGNFDVIVGVHAPLAERLATMKPHLHGTKTIGWIHNSFEALFGEDARYLGPERKRHYVYHFRRLDRVILLCNHDAESYREYDSRFKPTVIYNPLTLQPGEVSAGHSKRFLAVGRFSRRHKGFDLLIEAFNIFAKKNSEWHLDIVGEGMEEKMYHELISNYHLEDRVTIHPFTNNIQAYYSQAQVYVLSSRWEGFGLVLVEAMAHGLPVVSSDLPTSKEIMGDFGLYFKNGDISELAAKLEEATHLNWQAKSKEALQIARHFDVSHIVQQWKTLLDIQ